MRGDEIDVAAARLGALGRAARGDLPGSGWVPEPGLLSVDGGDDSGGERPWPDVERFWSPDPPPEPPAGRLLASRRAALAVVVVVIALLAGVLIRLALPSQSVTSTPVAGTPISGTRVSGTGDSGTGSSGGPAWPRSSPAPDATRVSPSVALPALPLAAAATSSSGVIVHVVGQVGRPGLVTLPPGSRVSDAVQAAGGARPAANLAGLNLARPLVDGEQVVVPGPGVVPAVPVSATAGSAAGGPAAVVDLNAASQEQLDAVPGIGPVIAGRIVAWRQAHGRFTSVDELVEVQGIGDKLLEKLRGQVRV